LPLALQDRSIQQAAREAQGLSLADIYEPANMVRSALSELENVTNENPTIETLLRFTKVVGRRLQIQVADS
jgi:transcriptional regulator with XRE-family HTH domain